MTALLDCMAERPREAAPRKRLTLEEWEQIRTNLLNESAGELNGQDGVDCPLCANKGYVYRLTDGGLAANECVCLRQRAVRRRMDASGLGKLLRECTFESFIDAAPWQKTMKALALEFCADKTARWFYAGGQPGSGKTHICAAICERFIRRGFNVRYLLWAEQSRRLKAAVTDYRAYASEMEQYKRVPVLYIDDFLKVRQGGVPSDGDLNLAFELLNARLLSDKITVISSEKTLEEALTYDEATVSRIVQQCGKYRLSVERDREKNYRMAEKGEGKPH